MKIFVVVLFCTFGLSSQHVNLHDGLIAWRRAAEPYIGECIHQSGVKPDLVELFFRTGYLADDAHLKCNFKCYTNKLRFVDALGNVDLERFKETIYGVDDKVAQRCSAFNDIDLCQKVFNMARCVVGSVIASTLTPVHGLSHVPNLY